MDDDGEVGQVFELIPRGAPAAYLREQAERDRQAAALVAAGETPIQVQCRDGSIMVMSLTDFEAEHGPLPD